MTRPEPIIVIPTLVEKTPPGVLATIASVRGSSPAPLLSRMFVSGIGETVGTVGGGCLEAEVAREAQRVRADGGWRRVAFALTEAEEDLRMVCGGTVELLIEKIGSNDLDVFRLLAERFAAGRTTLLARVFEAPSAADAAGAGAGPCPGAGAVANSPRLTGSGRAAPRRLLLGESGEVLCGDGALPDDARADALRAIHDERSCWTADGLVFVEPVVGLPRLVLFGAGHVSRAVGAVAREAGFRITVADDREKYASAARFPDAERIVVPGYQDLAERVPVAPHDYVLVCTRGHQFDEEILEQLLALPPIRYLGVIGSRRKHLAAERHLTEKGIAAERFRDLRAPVGLDIGAVTPEEIAVSIVAEMIAVRRRAAADAGHSLSAAKSL